MNALTMLNRSISTAHSTLPNNRRAVSEMDDDQRKAVMAKLGGGGGGYTGTARGGGSPMRKQRAQFARLSHEMEMRRQGQVGLQSDLTPIDLLASTAIESGLEGISQARLNTDNKWADAALGAVALGLLAAGIKNVRADARLAKSLTSKRNFEQVLEQMGRDADRFKPMLETAKGMGPSTVGDDIYRTYDNLAERVTRARGYPPTNAEANRWLDKVAPRADSVPRSRAGDIFRAEAAKVSGSQRGQYLDYARRADMEAIAPRTVRDPWTSVSSSVSDLRSQYGIGNRSTIELFKNSISTVLSPDEVLANAGPMTDEQRKAMFARMGSRGGGRGGPVTTHTTANTKQEQVLVRSNTSKTITPFEKWALTPQSSSPGEDRMITPPNAGPDYYEAKMVSLYERFLRENPYDQQPPAAWIKRYPEWKPKQNPHAPISSPDYPETIVAPPPVHQSMPSSRPPNSIVTEPGSKLAPLPTPEIPMPRPIMRGGPYNPGGEPGAIRLVSNAVRVAAEHYLIANAGPMSDEQRRAMFAKIGGPGGHGMFASPSRASSNVTRGPASMSSLPLYTRPDLNRIDQGIGLPGSERPSRKIDFARFDSLLENFKNTFPQDNGGIAMQMDSLLRPYRDNPTAFFDDPKAVDQLFNLVARSIVGNTGSKNYETKRGALESSFYNEGLKILQAAGLMQGWTAHSTFGSGGYQGVRFWNERPSLPQFYSSGMKAGPTASSSKIITSKISSGGSPIVRSGGGPSQAPLTKSGGYAPRQSYPGGPVFYGPKPGERGYIDIGQWRSGAQPKIPGKPATNPKTDTYIKKNRSPRDLLAGGIATARADFVLANAGPMTESQRKAMFASKASSGYMPPTTRSRIPRASGYNRNAAEAERQMGSGMDRAAALKEEALSKLSAAQKLLQSVPMGQPTLPSKGIIPRQNELQLPANRVPPGMSSIGDFEMNQMRNRPKLPTLPGQSDEVGIGDFERRQFDERKHARNGTDTDSTSASPGPASRNSMTDEVWQKRMDELQGILATQKKTQERWGYGGQIEGAENLIKAHLGKRGKYDYNMPKIDPQTAKKRNQTYQDNAYAKRMAAKDETIQKLLRDRSEGGTRYIDFDAWRRGALPKIPGKPWINNKPELGVTKPS